MDMGHATFVVVGGGFWGQGASVAEAKKRFQSAGGRLSFGYGILEFDAFTEFHGIDSYGRYHYKGTAPTLTEVKGRKSARR